jgi:UDP-N-acetyl-D-glucosamine dehydrogenase
VNEHGKQYASVELTDKLLSEADCVVITTNHSCLDMRRIVEKARLVVDTRNAVKDVSIENDKVFKL